MKKTNLIAMAMAATVAVSATPAAAIKVAVGPKISTLGVGVEATAQINNMLNFRTGLNYFKYKRKITDGEIDYNGKLRFLTVSALFDFHPFENGFRLSAGAMYNGNKGTLDARLNQPVTINGRQYTPAQAGNVDATVDLRKVSPYLGIGYEGAMHNESNWSFNAEAGVLFQGKPRVSVKSNSNLATPQMIADFKDDLQKATNKSYVRFYPVVSIGFKYRF